MAKIPPSILLAASLLALSTVGALAQSTPRDNTATTSSNRDNTATTNSKTIPAGADPNRPGATGDDIVRGDNSTIAGDRAATVYDRTGQE
jgi:hypothetical protein